MIHRQGRWLVWGPEDVVIMTGILGPDETAKGRTTPLDSVLRAASEKGVQLDAPLKRQLREAKRLRSRMLQLRKQEDVDPGAYPQRERLFPHQRVALAYLDAAGLPAQLLADQPGVGKTAPAVIWAENRAFCSKSPACGPFKGSVMVRHPRPIKKGLKRQFGPKKGHLGVPRILVIAPNSAKHQWRRAIREWRSRPLPIHVLDGTVAEQTRIAQRNGWVVGHWEAMVHAREGILARPWDAVILDEAHWMRNRKAQRSLTAFDLQAPYRLALTGHPFLNSPDELWSILHFLYPERYSSYWRFFSMHVLAVPKRFGGFEVKGTRDRKLLRWELSPFTLRRTKKRVFRSLPPVAWETRHVELSVKGRKEYEKLKKQFFAELETHSGSRVLAIPSVLARATRMRQYLVDPGLLGAKERSLKYPEVDAILGDLDGPPVVFTMFRQAAEALGRYLEERGHRVGLITGKVKASERNRVQRRFHQGKLSALIVVTQAGGEALNLGRYGYVVFLDLPWTAATLEQAVGRVDRPVEGTGETVPTTAIRVIVRDSYEETIAELIKQKGRMFEEVFSNRRKLKAVFK